MHDIGLVLHVASFAVWFGASLTFMIWGPAVRNASLEVWAHSWITLAKVQRALVAPACLVATVTGIYLTLWRVQAHIETGGALWLMVMQGLGIVAAILTLAFAGPLANRMGVLAERSLEKGAKEPVADAVRKRLALVGSLAGVLIIVVTWFAVLKPTSS